LRSRKHGARNPLNVRDEFPDSLSSSALPVEERG
jgi:hypothetical protein